MKVGNYIFYLFILLHVGVPKICQLMVDESPSSKQHSPLSLAAQTGDLPRVLELLSNGADPNVGFVAGPSAIFGA